MRLQFDAVLLTLLILAPPCRALDRAVEVAGGGRRSTDCFSTFRANANVPAGVPRGVRCTDGDPACDDDSSVNGACRFALSVCANSSAFADACVSAGIESLTVLHSTDNGRDPRFSPDLQALQAAVDREIAPPTTAMDACTSPVKITVRIDGPVGRPRRAIDRCRQASKEIRVSTLPRPLSGSGDFDRLTLTCTPSRAADGCSANAFFTGTFDRLQQQVFSPTCAIPTCHDSESYTASGLLLESGASYANLIGVEPRNAAARARGWRRVVAGEPALSFLLHKVDDDLDAPELGMRMPRPPHARLAPSLREIVRLWIEGGAPATGWVDGTH